MMTRRSFAASLAAVGAASTLSLPLPAAQKKRILILGGTGFLGPATVEHAQSRGHELTLFNRGKTRPGLFPDVRKLQGDRDPDKGEGLKALETGEWDAVIDNSAYFPRHVVASAKLLAPRVKQYILISSISAYADNSVENQDENAKLATLDDPKVEKITETTYGGLKVACEKAAQEAFGNRANIVRPGYIVGPDDPSGRFTYWPVRVDRGGEVLAPGAPTDPVQFIDVRDLGAWLVTLVENNTNGVFNATGPRTRLAWGDFLKSCQAAASQKSDLVWVPASFLAKQTGADFPIWAPFEGETRGFHLYSIQRALAAGLKFRPYSETVKDTLAWYKTQDKDGRTRLAGPKPEKEAEWIAAWRKSQPAG